MKNCSDNWPEKLRDSLGPVQRIFMPLKLRGSPELQHVIDTMKLILQCCSG